MAQAQRVIATLTAWCAAGKVGLANDTAATIATATKAAMREDTDMAKFCFGKRAELANWKMPLQGACLKQLRYLEKNRLVQEIFVQSTEPGFGPTLLNPRNG